MIHLLTLAIAILLRKHLFFFSENEFFSSHFCHVNIAEKNPQVQFMFRLLHVTVNLEAIV